MKVDYYNRIIVILQKLKETYPHYNMGRHLSTIVEDQGDLWGMSDKELANALDQYSRALSLDKPHEDKEIEQIINDGMHLDIYDILDDSPPIDD